MPALANVQEVRRYITERLFIGGSKQPNIFSPYAIDYIFQCSEGIPRLINNLCDNAMIAAYASGDQVIGRSVIEAVAENLDLLPDKDNILPSDRAVEAVSSARVLTPVGHEELLSERGRVHRDRSAK